MHRDTVYGVAPYRAHGSSNPQDDGADGENDGIELTLNRRALGWFATGILAFNSLYEAWLLLRPAGHVIIMGVDDAANCVGPLLAVLVFVALTKPWRRKLAVTLIGLPGAFGAGAALLVLSALSFAAGQAVWTYLELAAHRSTPFPSWADVGYIAAHVFLLAGVLTLCTRSMPAASRRRVLLDSVLIMTAVATFSWYFVLGPTALRHGESLLARAVSTSYPLSDLVLLLCLLLCVRSRERVLRGVVPPLSLALGVIIFVDSVYSYQLLHRTYHTGELIDPGWSLAFMLVVLVALAVLPVGAARSSSASTPSPEADEPSRSLQVWRSATPLVVIPAVGALSIYTLHAHSGKGLQMGVYVGAALVLALMMLHQIAVVLENVEANIRLRGFWKMAAEEDALRQSESRFRTLIQSMDVGVVLLGPDREFLMCNGAARDMLGVFDTQPGKIIFNLDSLQCDDPSTGMVTGGDVLNAAVSAGRPVRNIVVAGFPHPGVERTWHLMSAVPQRTQDGRVEQIICTFTDVTERREAEAALRESETRFRAIFEGTPVGIEIADMEGRLIATNSALQEMLGYSEEELQGLPFTKITHPDDIGAEEALDDELVAGRISRYQLEKRHMRKDGQPVWTRLTASEVRDARGEPQFAIAIVEDIRERKEAEQALAYQAMHDALTDLPNRTLLHDRLEQAISSARRNTTSMALLLMDLDRFKDVNDTFGHHYGDLLLQEVGLRLRCVLRESDTVARLGGDEFAVLLPAADEPEAMAVADKLLQSLARPYVLDSQSFDIGASVGIALYPDHGEDANALMRRADVAMYAAKRAAAGYTVYTPEQDQHTPARLTLIGDLRQAIESDQFLLYFQPKIHLRTGCAEHVEALVRWKHPHRGLIPPDQFIPLAEQTSLIKPLTLWVLDAALRQCKRWCATGMDMSVAVNLSAHSLHDPQLVDTIRDLLHAHDVKPSCLGVELTESAVMADPVRAMDTLSRLRHMGIQIAIDDFGTGYSSLGYLKRLPVDEIKIDKSFVMDMALNHDDSVIVRSVLDLGHNLGLQVVAEGVENQRIMDLLNAMGCDMAQGYHVCHPLSAEALMEWIKEPQTTLLHAS